MPNFGSEHNYTIDPTAQKKVILSVDGGGMRGAISIAMLAKLEEKPQKPCNELFDMVVGTSTGSIIAAGLAIGHSAQYLMEEVYLKRLPQAFAEAHRSWWTPPFAWLLNKLFPVGQDFIAGLLSSGLHHAYPMDTFREQLTPLLQAQGICTVGQLPNKPILLVTTKDVRSSDNYFVVSAGPGKEHFANWPLAGAVAASGAAPVFFPPVLSRLVDGGVGVYSNRCLAAATQAIEYFGTVPEDHEDYELLKDFRPDNTILVSLGTGYTPNNLAEDTAAKNKFIDWMRYVILESLDDAALQQVFVTRAIYGVPPHRVSDPSGRIDFRRYNPLLTRDSVETELGISLKEGTDPQGLGLDSCKPVDVELMIEIGAHYAERLCWSEPNVMPWDTVGGHHKPDPRSVFEENMRKVPVRWDESPYVCDLAAPGS